MADDFWGCPYTGGRQLCTPECLLFVRNHSTVSGRRMENYCKKFGRVDRLTGSDLAAQLSREEGVD